MNEDNSSIVILKQWLAECNEKSKLYGNLARKKQTERIILGIPTIICPYIFSIVSIVYQSESSPIASIGFAITGILNTIFAFLNFKEKSVEFDKFSNLYLELVHIIEIGIINNHSPEKVANDVRISMKTLDMYSPATNFCCI
jgi:hypothetical protein